MEISPNTINDYQLKLTNEKLQTVCKPFDFTNPQVNPIDFSNAMTICREKWKGIGLAANQVGYDLRIISIKGIESALFNPKIVYYSSQVIVQEEGCLSFPGLSVKIKRPEWVRVRFADVTGAVTTKSYHGLTARCIQHEIDHLDGILFYNKANKFHRELAFKQLKDRERKKKRVLNAI